MTGPAKWPVFKANAEGCQTGQSYVWRSNAGAGLLWQSRTDRFGGSHAKAPQDFGRWVAGRKDRARCTFAVCRWGAVKKLCDTARDSRCRIDEVHRPRHKLFEPRDQQGIMRAGEHDRVGSFVLVAKAGGDFGAQGGIVDRATMQLGLRISRKLFRSDQIDHAVLRVIANEGASIFALDGGFGTQHGDALRTRCGTSGLDRRNGADKRHGEFFSQGRQRDGRSGVAGNYDKIGLVFCDRTAKQSDKTFDQYRLGQSAIWERGV